MMWSDKIKVNEANLECDDEKDEGPCETMVKSKSTQDFLREHEVSFSFLHKGCVVRVGCKSYAFSDFEHAMYCFNEYVANPEKAHEKWNN